jgi:hypothetical protein
VLKLVSSEIGGSDRGSDKPRYSKYKKGTGVTVCTTANCLICYQVYLFTCSARSGQVRSGLFPRKILIRQAQVRGLDLA